MFNKEGERGLFSSQKGGRKTPLERIDGGRRPQGSVLGGFLMEGGEGRALTLGGGKRKKERLDGLIGEAIQIFSGREERICRSSYGKGRRGGSRRNSVLF